MFSLLKTSNQYTQYLEYCEKYNKDPSNFRYTIWEAKKRRISFLNKINSSLNDFQLGPSKFTDLTKSERKSFLNSSKDRKKRSQKVGASNTREAINSIRSKLRRRYENLKSRLQGNKQKFLSSFITSNSQERNWVSEGKVTSVKDQGQCGSCWAFAVAASLESIYLIKNNITYDLSEQEMVDCADDMDCNGGWNDLAIEYVKSNGLSEEANYPYEEKNGSCRVPSGETKIVMKDFKRIVKEDMEAFLKVLDTQPVNVGFQVEDDFLDYKAGVVDGDRLCGTTDEVNHAVLAVGYRIDVANFDNSYILFKNQWGTDWGEDGYFRFKIYDDKNTPGPCNSIRYSEDLVYPVLED